MPNQLIHETSPYLLQHANNPVNWFPWNDQALSLAKEENKPIFLSIGYSACHWCHVMAHESFEDPEIASILNQSFISIKVDREERPDIDSIYMSAVVAMTGQGGWPMSVFLTPDGKPFYGGTYFPPNRRYGMPSFRDVLVSVTRSWNEAPGEITPVADKLARHLQESAGWGGWEKQALRPETLAAAFAELESSYDWQNGGWGQAPKFPAPMTIEFLLRLSLQGNSRALAIAEHALQAMARGGIYDQVGGGFHRYSTDAIWLIPHFEKMLYDNAQLALVYLHAHQITGNSFYRRICEQTLDFLQRELLQPEGGFSSSLNADSEGEEGKFYVWKFSDLQAAIDSTTDIEWLQEVFSIQPNGNFEGNIILQQKQPAQETASRLDLSMDVFEKRLDLLLARLFEVRSKRIRPSLDEKVLTFWNALALSAFAEAGKALDRSDYLQIAQQNADFLLSHLTDGNRLLRSWRNGKAKYIAFLEDHAGLVAGLLALYQADFNPDWYQSAEKIATELINNFNDPAGGFFDTHLAQEELLVRPKDIQDNATPSGNALAALALSTLTELSGNSKWTSASQSSLSNLQEMMARYPNAFAAWLQCLQFTLAHKQEVALVWPGECLAPTQHLALLGHTYAPFSVQAASPVPLPAGTPPLLDARNPVDNSVTVYLCENFICKLPISRFEEFQSNWPHHLIGETSATQN